MKRFGVALLAFSAFVVPAHAWDTNAHKIVGVIAYRHLTPNAKAWCDGLLKTMPPGYGSFLAAAPYPDYLKHGSPAKDVKISHKLDAWHFIDYPVREGQTNPLPADTTVEGNGDNVLYGIQESIQSMTTGLGSTRGFYLAMLIHLVGDVHQPLHCAERNRDKGGNDFAIDRGSIDNLHELWDDAMTVRFKLRSTKAHTDERIEKAATAIESDCPLTDAAMRRDVADLDPRHWALESYGLAVRDAYSGVKPGEKPSDAYEIRWQADAERRVALAGYRLAALLNSLAAKRASD